ALLHSAIVVEKRDALKSWTILLAILAFSLSLVGTFLVRSGVLTSVHAVAIGGSLLLYAIRAPALKGGRLFAPISREGALVLNNILLATGCATVFLGTLYPLFLDAVGGPKLSVGYPFFDRTFVPLMVPLLLAVAAGPFLAWKRGDLGGALQRLWAAFGLAVLVGAVALYVTRGGPILAVGGLMLAAWVGGGVLVEWIERTHLNWRRAIHLPRAAHGMSLAHLGLAVTVAGIAASAWQQERIVVMHPGDNLAIGGYKLQLDRIGIFDTPSYHAERADLSVGVNGKMLAVLHPEKRTYPLEQMTRGETAIRTTLLADLYLALGDDDGKGGATIRAYWKPL